MSNGIGSIRGLDGKKVNIIGVAILWHFKIRRVGKAQEPCGNIQIKEGLVSSTTQGISQIPGFMITCQNTGYNSPVLIPI